MSLNFIKSSKCQFDTCPAGPTNFSCGGIGPEARLVLSCVESVMPSRK
jgi:hypothetical protein